MLGLVPNGNFIDIDQIRLHYVTKGEGIDVVFIHGFLDYSGIWEPLFDTFLKRGSPLRLIAFDLPGSGFSSKNLDFSYSLEDLSTVTSYFIERVAKRKPVYVVGHSMGGGIALGLASQFPQLVEKIVVIDSIGFTSLKETLKVRLLKSPYLGKFIFKYIYNKSIFERYFYNDVYFRKEAFSKERIELLYRLFDDPIGREVLYKEFLEIVFNSKKVVHYLDKIKNDKEIIAIWGKEDKLFPYENVTNFLKSFALQIKIELIERCGHSPVEETPEEVAKILLKYFDKGNI